MIWGGYFMCDGVFGKQGSKEPITEMFTSITDKRTRSTKTAKDISLNELNHNCVVIGFGSNGLYPFRYIVHRHKYVLMTSRWRERSHEVNAPYIKYLNNKNRVERHHSLPGHCAKALTSLTRAAE